MRRRQGLVDSERRDRPITDSDRVRAHHGDEMKCDTGTCKQQRLPGLPWCQECLDHEIFKADQHKMQVKAGLALKAAVKGAQQEAAELALELRKGLIK